jgi:hypothetical protein
VRQQTEALRSHHVAVVVVAQLLHLWHHHQVRLVCVCVCVCVRVCVCVNKFTSLRGASQIPVAKQVDRLT